ncbi:hypothetical protein GJ496_003104 [Pomphorhynchus laevis]|nr:hypothetical protein GJ496_003104 [Pomphorhynchus laevis]
MGHLILQQIPSNRVSEIRKTLKRRMSMWMDGDIPELYKEAKYLQNRITSSTGNHRKPNIDMELRSIICLPLRLGGMGVSDPSTEPKTEFDRSQRMVSQIINANGSISQKSIAMEIHEENKKIICQNYKSLLYKIPLYKTQSNMHA